MRSTAEEADHGLRPSRLSRRGSALAHPEADRAGARLAARRGRRGARERGARGAPEALARTASLATNVEYYSAIVLDVAEIPPPLAPAMFACSRVAGWSAHILEQKRTGRLFRPSARYVGPAERTSQLSHTLVTVSDPRPCLSWPTGNRLELGVEACFVTSRRIRRHGVRHRAWPTGRRAAGLGCAAWS